MLNYFRKIFNMETIECKREDGSVFAVLETYKEDDGKRFVRINIVEDSDWLYIDDMQALAIQLHTNVLKLQFQDDKS